MIKMIIFLKQDQNEFTLQENEGKKNVERTRGSRSKRQKRERETLRATTRGEATTHGPDTTPDSTWLYIKNRLNV